MFLIQNHLELITECGYLKNEFFVFVLEVKFVLVEQNEEYLDCNKNEEGSVFEKILNR